MKSILLQLSLLILIGGLDCTHIQAQLSSDLIRKVEGVERFYAQRKVMDAQKQILINKLKEELVVISVAEKKYLQYKLLYHEYFSFKSYEAYHAAVRMERLANHLQNDELSFEAALHKAEILLCSGLFNEAILILDQLKGQGKGKQLKDYFRVMTRLYGDLKTYNDLPAYRGKYEQLNHVYTDSLSQLLNVNSVNYLMVTALKLIDLDKPEAALERCNQFLQSNTVSDHNKAMIYSCMAWGAANLNDLEKQITYLLLSIESDIKSSTYETTSARVLAQLLLENGEIELAHKFALRAMEDAEFYGARQRKVEISHVVPIIEKQLKALQAFKLRTAAIISVLVLLAMIVIIYLWLRLMKRHKEVRQGHAKINEQNTLLSDQNGQLLESNKIKEEYLTSYFELSSVYFHEMENIQAKVRSLLLQKKYIAIADYLDVSGPKEDKDFLFKRFDELFLNLFPTFLPELGKVLNDSANLWQDQNRLTSELRVFALNRLGITSADRIASILGISRNTVYTYRNRIKTKSMLGPDDFEKFIMKIPTY